MKKITSKDVQTLIKEGLHRPLKLIFINIQSDHVTNVKVKEKIKTAIGKYNALLTIDRYI